MKKIQNQIWNAIILYIMTILSRIPLPKSWVLSFLIFSLSACSTFAQENYPKISKKQHDLAVKLVHAIHSFRWDETPALGKSLANIESQDSLVPLSYLLMIAERTLRLQNNDYISNATKKSLVAEIDSLQKQGMLLIAENQNNGYATVTDQFVMGGIMGFLAIQKIDSNPIQALSDGIKAVKILEEVIKKDSTNYDAYLGLGLYHCILATQPVFLRMAIKLFSRSADMDTGLQYLRLSAKKGRYTKAIAAQYLIQFLSPYYGHLLQEKYDILTQLQSEYPANAFYLFLELDESLCFDHSHYFTEAMKKKIDVGMRHFRNDNYSLALWESIVQRHRFLIDQNSSTNQHTDTDSFNYGNFSFYPPFLQANSTALQISKLNPNQEQKILALRKNFRELYLKTQKLLANSNLSAHNKRFYSWHIRDALRREIYQMHSITPNKQDNK